MNATQEPFSILSRDGFARTGRYRTAHGPFQTPNFMPVGTLASVKGIDCERLSEVGAEITLVNTYHLWQRPGDELIQRLGGVHVFENWNGPILSDSGGFQVFSLQGIRKVTEEGVQFQSHLDGHKLFLSPEKAIAIQENLGVDIAMVLDECPRWDLSYDAQVASLERTHRWAKRCLEARRKEGLQLFSITQGACHRALRTLSAETLAALPFDGHAIGGVSVGEPKEEMLGVLSYHVQQLPDHRIRYLMGVGTPLDIFEGVATGVDLFDCVMPTRSGRFARAFVSGEEPYLNIRNARFKEDREPLDRACSCVCCRNYSRAYLHHLFRCSEMLGPQMLSLHNLAFYLGTLKQIRDSIVKGTFERLLQAERHRWSDVEATPRNDGEDEDV